MEILSLVILMGWYYIGRRIRRWRMWGGWCVIVLLVRRIEIWVTRFAGRIVLIGCFILSGMVLVLFYFYCILFCFFWGGVVGKRVIKLFKFFLLIWILNLIFLKKNYLFIYIFKEIGICMYRLFVIFRFILNRYYMYKLL